MNRNLLEEGLTLLAVALLLSGLFYAYGVPWWVSLVPSFGLGWYWDRVWAKVRGAFWYQVGELAKIYGARDLQWWVADRLGVDPGTFPPWVPRWRMELSWRAQGPHEGLDTRLLPGDMQPATPHVLEPRDPRDVFRVVRVGPEPLLPPPAPFHAGDLLDPPPFVLSELEGESVDVHCLEHVHTVRRSSPFAEDHVVHCRSRQRWYLLRWRPRRWETDPDAYPHPFCVGYLRPEALQAPRRPDLEAPNGPPGLEAFRGFRGP